MARIFGASGARLTLGSAPVTAAPFSVSLWVRYDPALVGSCTFFCLGVDASANNRWSLIIDEPGNTDQIDWQIRTSNNATVNGGTAIVGAWNHVCVVETSATDHALYVNGSVTLSTSSKAAVGVNRITLGAGTNAGDLSFAGLLADFGFWNVALTASEVARLYRKDPVFTVRPTALYPYAPLGLSDSEPDLVKGQILTRTGAVGWTPHPNGLWLPGTYRNLYGSTYVPLGVPLAKRRPASRRFGYVSAAGGTIGWFNGSTVVQKPIYRKESGGSLVPVNFEVG